jgi:hypothetical protein
MPCTHQTLSDKIKKNEMGRACSTYGEKERCMQGFGKGHVREGDHLEDAGIKGRIILKSIFEKRDGGMNWIDVAQDRDR